MEEIWKDIPGFKNYQASNLGRIRSTGFYQKVFSKKVGYYDRYRKGTILKPAKRKPGEDYLFVTLCIDGVVTNHFVHKLVALTFPEICGEWFEGAEISHLDENPGNNIPTNLKWVTHTENNNWGSRLEKSMSKIRKPVWQMSLDGQLIERYNSASEAANNNGFLSSNIANVCNGKGKTAFGYKWVKESDLHPFVLRLLKDVYILTPLFANRSSSPSSCTRT